jgi:hypothetical protein
MTRIGTSVRSAIARTAVNVAQRNPPARAACVASWMTTPSITGSE